MKTEKEIIEIAESYWEKVKEEEAAREAEANKTGKYYPYDLNGYDLAEYAEELWSAIREDMEEYTDSVESVLESGRRGEDTLSDILEICAAYIDGYGKRTEAENIVEYYNLRERILNKLLKTTTEIAEELYKRVEELEEE